MKLQDKLERILGDVKESLGWVTTYPAKKHNLLLYAYKKELIKVSDIDNALKEGILESSRMLYNVVINGFEKPDHAAPEILAYGILNNQFSDKEISRIKFDHEKDAIEFCRTYAVPDLIQRLRQKLLLPKPTYNEFSSSLNSGGFCECCPPCCGH